MGTFSVEDTIIAIASPPGGAARGVLRLSGPQTSTALRHVFVADGGRDWHTASTSSVFAGRLDLGMQRLPCELYYWPTVRSYTGQSAAEIHTIGSPILLQRAVRHVCQFGVRLAEPGEFTLRAFLAGRLDLPQAEAVLGVIEATTDEQLQTALGQLAGGLSHPLRQLRSQLLDLLADVEAGLDFVDEDIEFISNDILVSRLGEIRQALERVSSQLMLRSHQAVEYRVTLVGAPNVGKSSLWNALLGKTGAIVSDIPGTTRDYLTDTCCIGGFSCKLVDTAGVDELHPTSMVDHAAQQITTAQREASDVRILCLDGSRNLSPSERMWLQTWGDEQTLMVMTKCDLPRVNEYDGRAIATSSRNGGGLNELREAVRELLVHLAGPANSVVPATIARCHGSLTAAIDAVRRALDLTRRDAGEELVAGELRVALDELGGIVGVVYTEDLLDRIFSRFCIGK